MPRTLNDIYGEFKKNYQLGRDQEFAINENRSIEADKGMATIVTAGLAYILIALLNKSPNNYLALQVLDFGALSFAVSLISIFWNYNYLNWFSGYSIKYLDDHKRILDDAKKITDTGIQSQENLAELLKLQTDEFRLNKDFNDSEKSKSNVVKFVNNIQLCTFGVGILCLTYFLLANIN